MFIPDPDFYPSRIPDLGSRIPDLGSRIPDPKTGIKERGALTGVVVVVKEASVSSFPSPAPPHPHLVSKISLAHVPLTTHSVYNCRRREG
jgi:hypothetical protein